MLIGITGSPRQTDHRLAKHLEGMHFFTHYDMRSSLKNALLALYGPQLYDYTTMDKKGHLIPFAGNQTYETLEENLHRFLKATSGPTALRDTVEAMLSDPVNASADIVVTGITVDDAGWLHAQGGMLVLVDDALDTGHTPPRDVPHFVFYNDHLDPDEFQIAADTMLDKGRRRHLNVIQKG